MVEVFDRDLNTQTNADNRVLSKINCSTLKRNKKICLKLVNSEFSNGCR